MGSGTSSGKSWSKQVAEAEDAHQKAVEASRRESVRYEIENKGFMMTAPDHYVLAVMGAGTTSIVMGYNHNGNVATIRTRLEHGKPKVEVVNVKGRRDAMKQARKSLKAAYNKANK